MRLLAFLFLALAALAQVPSVDSFSQIPGVARSGQKVRLRYRLTGPADKLVLTLTGTTTQVPFSNIGNNTWEAEITAPATEPRLEYTRFLGTLSITLGSNTNTGSSAILKLDGGDLPTPTIVSLAPDARRTDYVVNLIVPSFFQTAANGNYQGLLLENAARRFYQLFNDDFDFLHLIAAGPSFYDNRYHGRIKGDVQGIGAPIVNGTANWGSKGKLLGFTAFPNTLVADGADEGVSHETGHQWMMYTTKGPLANGYSHWPLSTMATGVMGYSDPTPGSGYQGFNFPCKFDAQADGSYNITFDLGVSTFTDLDLYFMGLIPASQVGTNVIISDATKISEALQKGCGVGKVTASQIQKLTVADVIALNGPRVPAFPDTQRNFRAATIVVTRDAFLSDEEMAFFDHYARRVEAQTTMPSNQLRLTGYTNPWAMATKGLSQFTTRLTAGTQPTIAVGGIVNAGSFSAKSLTPGSVATIFGTNFTTQTASATSVPLPTTLGGVTVRVNGTAVPLFYVSPTQINFQLPADLKTAPFIPQDPAYLARVRVHNATGFSNEAFLESYANAPGIITYSDNQAVAQDSQFRLIGPNNPAKAGDTITVYFVGASTLRETIPAGTPTPTDRLIPITATTRASLNGTSVPVVFMGLTPGSVGLLQANITIPAGTAPGVKTLQLIVGNSASNSVRLSTN